MDRSEETREALTRQRPAGGWGQLPLVVAGLGRSGREGIMEARRARIRGKAEKERERERNRKIGRAHV